MEKHHGKGSRSSHTLVQQSSAGLFSPLQPERCRAGALRALLLTLSPWVGAAVAVGCCQRGWAGSWHGDRCPRQGVAGRGKLCVGTTAHRQLSASRDSFCGGNRGEQMVKHPTGRAFHTPSPCRPQPQKLPSSSSLLITRDKSPYCLIITWF